jgi:hypothetical protein
MVKLKASSILESIIALTLIMISFSIGITVITRFAYPSINVRKEKAVQILQQQIIRIREDQYFNDMDTMVNGLHISINIVPYNDGLMQVRGIVSDDEAGELAYENALISIKR